jgi:colanic acid biosynthesis glycosyl transferase WcaI
MAKILILSLVFPPDQVSTAQIMGDIAVDLKEQGHQVTVITTRPHYNPVEDGEPQGLEDYWWSLLQVSDFNGIEVFHTAMMRKGRSIFSRLVSYVLFHTLSLLAGLFVIERPDIILAPSPPLTIALTEWLLGVRYRVPFVYIVQEIFPDILIDMGVIRSSLMIKLLTKLEAFVYHRAAKLVAITEQMRQRLIDKGVPPSRAVTIPNFVNTEELRPAPKRNDFSTLHGIDDRYVVSYAGNLGPVQLLDDFIKAADILRDDRSIRLLIVGDGILREDLRTQVVERGLENMLMLPYQPYSRMQQIYAASDLCLVPQSSEAGPTSMPSKVYRIMACARPVLVYADPASELGQLVREVGCGIAVPAGEPQALADAIREAAQSPETMTTMGAVGRKHVEDNYARKVVTDRYGRLVMELIGSSVGR